MRTSSFLAMLIVVVFAIINCATAINNADGISIYSLMNNKYLNSATTPVTEFTTGYNFFPQMLSLFTYLDGNTFSQVGFPFKGIKV